MNGIIIAKTAANTGAVFSSDKFESLTIAATSVVANFAVIDHGGTTRDSLTLSCATGDSQALARGFSDLVKSGRTVILDDIVDDFAGLEGCTGISVSINGAPVTRNHHVIAAADGDTLKASDSGGIVVMASALDVKLPTPEVGLRYMFLAKTAFSGTNATVLATTNGTTQSDLFFAYHETNDATASVDNANTITFVQGTVAVGDYAICECIDATTTDGNPSWHVRAFTSANNGITITAA